MKKAILVSLGLIWALMSLGQSFSTVTKTRSFPTQAFANGHHMYFLNGSAGFGFNLYGMDLSNTKDSVKLLEDIYQNGLNLHNFIRVLKTEQELYVIAELGKSTIEGAALYEVKGNTISKLADLGKSKIRGAYLTDDKKKLFIPMKDLEATSQREALKVFDFASATVTELVKGEAPIKKHEGAILGNDFIFSWKGPEGIEPWISDGTSTGTKLLKDLDPGSSSTIPHYFFRVKGWVYFNAFFGPSVYGYRTDGKIVEDLKDIKSGQYITGMRPVGKTDDRLLYSRDDVSIKGLFSIDQNGDVDALTREKVGLVQVVNSQVYFSTEDADEPGKVNLYVSNGTDKDTELFFDLGDSEERISLSLITQIVGYGHDILFMQNEVDDDFDAQIWYSNGTRKGTRAILDTINANKRPDTTYNKTTSTNFFTTMGNAYFHTWNQKTDFYEFLQITGLTGIDESVETVDAPGYPNPVKNVFNISYEVGQSRDVVICDLSGKSINSAHLAPGNTQMDLSGFKSGVYVIRVSTSDRSMQFKIVKE